MVFIISCWGNIIQSNFTGQASLFPASYMRSMVNGQAVSGLFASLAKIASLLSDRSLQSKNESDEIVPEKLILPIFCFLIFNLGDFLGRFIGSYMLLTKDSKITLLLISIFRIIFIPIFIYCNAQPRHHLVLFSSEIYFVIFNFIFALLNGYLVLNVFVNAPLTIPEQHRQIAGYLLVSFLGFGLTLGSLTSPLIVDIL
ncbi:Equilibrative nucleoside transporter 1-like protein [Sarcoptes scabiei]|uniref:Equilibrative nucleoside transporter 1-like protein n=1 Tax=Sarcoptes scabiei TaxID=52283 RepID=A0A132A017_SARSC|nr:Equilibrative nucleoside transporter 1-like protein [Sarcoptes scabiei]